MMRDGASFVVRTPLVRGLVIGIIGAFAAGGTVIGSATLYAASLGGGNAAYGVLFASVFVGLAIGMGAAPRMARGSRTTGCSARRSSPPGWRWCWWRSPRTCSWRSRR